MMAFAVPIGVGAVTGTPPFVMIGALTFFALATQRRSGGVRENPRALRIEAVHPSVQGEHALIEGQRLLDVVRRVDGVHEADHARLVGRILNLLLRARQRRCEQDGRGV